MTMSPRTAKDIHHYQAKLKWARKKVLSESFSQEDKDALLGFADFLLATGISLGRITKYVYHLITMRRRMTCNFRELDRRKVEEVVAWLNVSDYKPWTRADMRGALKRFQKWLRNGNLDWDKPFPPEVAWIRGERPKANELEDPVIITGKEAERMISETHLPRDRALIAVAHEGGFRIGELLGMQIKDVIFDDRGARVSVKGKTGPRTVRLITSSPLLALWMDIHKARQTGDAPLWYSMASNDHLLGMSYVTAMKVFKSAAVRAGVSKRVYPHLFRHSAATRDARFLTEHELIVKYGWSNDSRAPARYVHLSGKDIDDKLVSIYSGREIEPPRPDFEPVRCPRCREKNTQGAKYCGRCGTPLDPAELARTGVQMEELQNELLQIRREIALMAARLPSEVPVRKQD